MKRQLVLLATAAVVVVAAVVYLARSDRTPARTEGERPTATFRPHAGAPAEPAGRGVFRVGSGASHIEVKEPTLVNTPAGPIELEPGEYDLRVDGGDVTVTVHRGRAVFRGQGEPRVAEFGSVLLVTAVGGAPTPDPKTGTPPAGPITTVTGRIVDGDGAPIAGARVWAGAEPASEGRIIATTDAGGRYRGDDVAERYVGARADGRAPSDLRRIDPAARTVFEMNFMLRHAGGALRVEVVDETMHRVPGAAVVVGGLYRSLPFATVSPEGYPQVAPGERRLVTDEAGRAEASDLPPGWRGLRVVRRGYAPYYAGVRLPPAVEETTRVTLRRGVAVHGVVRDEQGAPLPGVRISFRQKSGDELADLGATTDARGAYRVDAVPPRRLAVFARAPDGRRASAWLVLERGEDRVWDTVLPDVRAITGTLVYDDGAPVADARVHCQRVSWAGEQRPDVGTDETGAFRFAPVDDALHELTIWVPFQTSGLPPVLRVHMTPDESPKTITLPRDAGKTGSLKGMVVLPGGEPAKGTIVTVWPEGDPGFGTQRLIYPEGTFEFGPLRAGANRLEAHLDGQPTLHLDVEIEAGAMRDLGVLKFPAGGRIRARVVGTDGAASVHRSYILVASLDQRIQYSVKPDTGGFWISEDLAPGRYLVHGGVLGLSEEAEVRAGETTQVELKWPPMGKLVVTFVRTDGTAPRELSYEVRDDAGRPVTQGALDADTNRLDMSLAAGRYTVAGTDEHGRKAEAVLDAPADGEAAQTLTLR